jgi:hypothetical protein
VDRRDGGGTTRSADPAAGAGSAEPALPWTRASGAIALFLVLRGFNLYGDPRPWGVRPRG